jgi:hypothetical protein
VRASKVVLSAAIAVATVSLPISNAGAAAKPIDRAEFVLCDTMPGNNYYANGIRSATTPGWLGQNEDQDEAEGFLVSTRRDVRLSSLDLALWFESGVNTLNVYLVKEQPRTDSPASDFLFEPNVNAVVERWTLRNAVPNILDTTGNVVHIRSAKHPLLRAGVRYWVYISVPGPASAIAWISRSTDYEASGGVGWFAERNSAIGFRWSAFAQPGFAMRVTARH